MRARTLGLLLVLVGTCIAAALLATRPQERDATPTRSDHAGETSERPIPERRRRVGSTDAASTALVSVPEEDSYEVDDPPTRRVVVTVLDTARRPVSGARVALVRHASTLRAGSVAGHLIDETTSDRSGTAVVRGKRGARMQVVAERAGRVGWLDHVPFDGDRDVRVEVMLDAATRISGTVRDDVGLVVPNVVIALHFGRRSPPGFRFRSTVPGGPRAVLTARSDDTGKFAIDVPGELLESLHLVTVEPLRGYLRHKGRPPPDDLGASLDVQLVRACVVTGLFVRPDGTPLGFGAVDVKGEKWRDQTRTDEDGRIELSVPRGAIHLTATARDSVPWESGRIDATGPSVDLGRVRLARGATVSGHVVDRNGKPVSGASVTIGARSVATQKDGSFTVGGLEPGSHRVKAEAMFNDPWVTPDDAHAKCEAPQLGLTLRLSPSYIVEVRFVDSRGEPIEVRDPTLVLRSADGSATRDIAYRGTGTLIRRRIESTEGFEMAVDVGGDRLSAFSPVFVADGRADVRTVVVAAIGD